MPREEFSVYLGVKITPTQKRRLQAYAEKAKGEGQADLVRRWVEEGLNREDGAVKLAAGNKVTLTCHLCGVTFSGTEIPAVVARMTRHADTVHTPRAP